MVEAAFVTHFPIPPIYPYLPFTLGYYIISFIYDYIKWATLDHCEVGVAHCNIYTDKSVKCSFVLHTVWHFRGTFEDEISQELKHTGAGILSMANRCALLMVALPCHYRTLVVRTPTVVSFSLRWRQRSGWMVSDIVC